MHASFNDDSQRQVDPLCKKRQGSVRPVRYSMQMFSNRISPALNLITNIDWPPCHQLHNSSTVKSEWISMPRRTTHKHCVNGGLRAGAIHVNPIKKVWTEKGTTGKFTMFFYKHSLV